MAVDRRLTLVMVAEIFLDSCGADEHEAADDVGQGGYGSEEDGEFEHDSGYRTEISRQRSEISWIELKLDCGGEPLRLGEGWFPGLRIETWATRVEGEGD